MNNKLDLTMDRVLRITLSTTDYRVKWAGDALAYYIHSGRASTPWVKAFTRANTAALLDYMAHGPENSDQVMIQRADVYIRKHHRLI